MARKSPGNTKNTHRDTWFHTQPQEITLEKMYINALTQ